MARILFVWELGSGFGHLTAYQGMFSQLMSRGHSLQLVVRDLGNTERVFGRTGIPALQAPILPRGVTGAAVRMYSYAQILQNIGFADPSGLLGRIKAWRHLYDAFAPDLVFYDHSPTALLAFRSRPCRHIVCGTGFSLPPLQEPMPAMRDWEEVPTQTLRAAEAPVLAAANQALDSLGEPPLGALWQVFDKVRPVLRTFAELDHYKSRQHGEYHGMYTPIDFGARPQWPEGDTPRVFAYLYPFQTLPALLRMLAESGFRAVVYAPEVADAVKAATGGGRLRFVREPVCIEQVGGECDVAITNGNFATTANMLLAGKPVLVLPTDLEKQILGRRVEQFGAGLTAPRLMPQAMAAKLRALLEEPRYREAAGVFAARYADRSAMRQGSELADIVETELAR